MQGLARLHHLQREARPTNEPTTRFSPGSAALLAEAKLLADHGHFAEASRLYRDALTRLPASSEAFPDAVHGLVQTYARSGRAPEGRRLGWEQYDRCNDPPVREELLRHALWNPDDRDRWRLAAIELLPRLEKVERLRLACVFLALMTPLPPGSIAEVDSGLRAAVDEAESDRRWSEAVRSCWHLARLLMAEGRPQEASEALRRGCAAADRAGLPAKRSFAYNALAECYRDELHEYGPALAAGRTAQEGRPPSIWGALTESQCYLKLEDYPSALRVLDRAEAQLAGSSDPDRGYLSTIRVMVLHGLKRDKEAIALVLASQKQSSDHLLNAQAAAWADDANEQPQARRLAELAVEGLPPTGDGGVWQTYYRILEHQGESARALRLAQAQLTSIATSTPGELTLVAWCCQELLQAGRESEARALFERWSSPELKALLRRQHLPWWQKQLAEGPQPSPRAVFFETQANLRTGNAQGGDSLLLRSSVLEALQKRLQPDQLLVGYFQAGSEMTILGLDREHLHTAVLPLSEVTLAQDTSLVRARLADPHDLLESVDYRQAESNLFRALLQPVEPWLHGRTLLVVPRGALWYLPFAALRDDAGRPWGERVSVVRLSSGDLTRLLAGEWKPYAPGPGLALGAPPEAELPGAATELNLVGTTLDRCAVETGNEATASNLRALGNLAHVIHLATHSVPHPSEPLETSLMLHGASLTVREIYGLHFDRSPLVVLSSCSSAQGQPGAGAEPISLATAFSAAGAGAVVSSLWPVDDDVTQQLFGVFYRCLQQGSSPVAALAAAQAAVRVDHPHPFYWAPFVLTGCPD